MGKTTLLKTLMGKVPVKDGRVLLKGQDITHTTSYKRVRRGIGYVPQGREIFGLHRPRHGRIVLVEQYCDFAKELADATASLSEVPAS